MINFILIKKETLSYTPSDGYIKINLSRDYNLFLKNIECEKKYTNSHLIIIGDCINKPIIDTETNDINEIINKLKGNFYAFLKNGDNLFITSSTFGLLPIYYLSDFSVISSSVTLINRLSKKNLKENKKWILNQLIFNYQFGNETFFKDIRLFPAFSYLKINNSNYEFIKYYDIRNEFVSKPESLKSSLDNLRGLFIETADKYIPDQDAVISFTGGFDGRTLVSIALNSNKKFSNFSYGKPENDDVYIPKTQSKKLNLPFIWVNLEEEYSSKKYFENAINFIEHTDGGNGFLYAHVNYAAEVLKNNTQYLLSGICGSELFRALHIAGAVTSKALVTLFSTADFDRFYSHIKNSDSLSYLNIDDYKEDLDQVIENVWHYKSTLPDHLTINQKFYVFVFEEIFRKFFGAWVKDQMQYLKVRTPYTDFDFFKELIKTEISGAYNDFFTDNPLKRYKGQIFYTDVIKKTNKRLYKMKTGKGYSPMFVRNPFYRPLLFYPYLTKRMKRNIGTQDMDNLGIISGIKNSYIATQPVENSSIDMNRLLKDINLLTKHTSENKRDTILSSLSIFEYWKMNLENDK